MTTAYPLHWPGAWPRTPRHRRRRSQFGKTSVHRECTNIRRELERAGARVGDVVISTNVTLRLDGLPYSNQRPPEDPGVAVYWVRKGRDYALACDRWDLVEHNLRAIAKHIEALRGQERWGVGSLDQAFAGYAQIPEQASAPTWRSVLGLNGNASPATVRAAYRELAKRVHPDRPGGNAERFVQAQRAYEAACSELGVQP